MELETKTTTKLTNKQTSFLKTKNRKTQNGWVHFVSVWAERAKQTCRAISWKMNDSWVVWETNQKLSTLQIWRRRKALRYCLCRVKTLCSESDGESDREGRKREKKILLSVITSDVYNSQFNFYTKQSQWENYEGINAYSSQMRLCWCSSRFMERK